jgi:hypothetical protein
MHHAEQRCFECILGKGKITVRVESKEEFVPMLDMLIIAGVVSGSGNQARSLEGGFAGRTLSRILRLTTLEIMSKHS